MKNQLNKLIKEYRSLQPLLQEAKRALDKKFRLEFNFNSNHLEGNTLTYGETKLLLLFDQTKGVHEMREYEEMKAHDVALQLIKEEAANIEKPLTERFIKELNEIILVRPFWKDAITAEGQSTRRQIKIGGYKEYPNSVIQANGEVFEYASPQDTPIEMGKLVEWYNDEVGKGEFSPIELAALLHYRFIRIHPFDDGNGRVARLLVNYVLYHNDLPPIIIKSAEKKEYLRALQQADAGNLQAFVDYMIQQQAWSLDLSIRAAKGESIDEQDDWEKELSLLKKKMGDKSGEVVKKSEQSVKAVYENVVLPIAHMYDNRLSQFESLFFSNSLFISWNKLSDYYTHVSEWENEINLLKDAFWFLHKDDQFSITKSFSLLRSKEEKINFKGLKLSVKFYENAYLIKYLDKEISKLYSDYLTQDEMNTIVSEIGKGLMQKIEKAISESQCKK